MSSRTKIVVLRMKEIIYTAIFAGLAILLITLFLFMLRARKAEQPAGSQDAISSEQELSASYIPGVYTASISLGSQTVNVEVAVDTSRITSISLVPLDETVATMYPLIQPSLDHLAEQIIASQSLEGITYESGSRYTSQVLLNAIETALSKAAAE